MTNENDKQPESEEDYEFDKLEKKEEVQERPKCAACGDPVKIVVHSGGTPMAAKHCRECYAELRWGKIPKSRGRRRL